jgi:3-oxoacyl-[acyl-carrier protein] reductase
MSIEANQSGQAKPLLGRVAIVTGAGQGMGRGIAKCLAGAGANIVVAEYEPERIAPAVAEIEALGVDCLGVRTDISKAGDVKQAVQQTLERFGQIDILVNNAGRVVIKPMVEQTEEDWDRVLDTNLKGVFLCCREVLPHMIARQRGAIVNIASIAAFHTTVPHVPYAASKAGVVALPDEQRRAALPKILVGRMGQPEDIGEAALFLVSDAASYITGATLRVSGGTDLKVFNS